MKTIINAQERAIANYLVDSNRLEINRISSECASPLIAVRQAVKKTAEAIGKTELRSQPELTHDEWIKLTRWIAESYFPVKHH